MRLLLVLAALAAPLAAGPAAAQIRLDFPDKTYIDLGPRAEVVRVRPRSARHVRVRSVRARAATTPRQARRTTSRIVTRGRTTILPRTGSAGVTSSNINRNLLNEQQNVQQQQQNQFEVNQLRQGLDRGSVSGAPPTGLSTNSGRICPPGATGC